MIELTEPPCQPVYWWIGWPREQPKRWALAVAQTAWAAWAQVPEAPHFNAVKFWTAFEVPK